MSDDKQTHLDFNTNTAFNRQVSDGGDYAKYATYEEEDETETDFYTTYDKVMSELSRPTSKLQAAEQ